MKDKNSTITHLDSLGRPFCVETTDGKLEESSASLVSFLSFTVLDIEGNEKEIKDARNNTVMEYKYGIHGEKAYTKSMDAGERWMLLAADEQPIYTWDSREHKLHTEYDELRRPIKQWLNDETLVGETVYGESESNTPETNNMRGHIWKVYDQSGEVINIKYDFKDNLLESKRRLTQEYKTTINWDANPALETETFTTITAYDALNRATEIQTPHNNNIPASKIMPEYDDGGLLKGVKAKLRGATEATSFVETINYNPKGQRTRIKYGNGATTKYTYDDKTFRLTRLWTFRNGGTENLQDLNYTYDPVGNITQIIDNAQKVVFHDNKLVSPSQTFEYDALYRLTKATGREHANNVADMETLFDGYPHAHTSIPNDTSALRNYTRKWKYDEVGNILKLIHCVNNGNGNWNRSYEYEQNNNQLMSTTVSDETANYEYNEHGSMKKMPHLEEMTWDFAERLCYIERGTTKAYYNYDGSGERVRKIVEKGSIVETRLYLGGFEIYRKKDGNTLELERETLHVMDDSKRIALVETLTVGSGSPVTVQRYQLSNNIESATLELDEVASIISYEEYYPYGDTCYQAGRSANEVSQKRYRYTGKEKDEESGLYYHGARYYACWLGRWTVVDPAGLVDGVNLYMYCRGNPIIFLDDNGNQASGGDVLELHDGYEAICQIDKYGNATCSIVGEETADIDKEKLNKQLKLKTPNISDVKSLVSSYAKKAFEFTVKFTAEIAAQWVYPLAEIYVKVNPELIERANSLISDAKQNVETTTNMDPNTMGWLDLTKIWLFESGEYPHDMIHFGSDAVTTKRLQGQEGVSKAREKALGNIKSGNNENISHYWRFDTKQLYKPNPATFFLGSYNTTVSIEKANDSLYTLTFTVDNTSGWESATRLRQRGQSIIPNKNRGKGIKLGGDVSQKWIWTETINSQ